MQKYNRNILFVFSVNKSSTLDFAYSKNSFSKNILNKDINNFIENDSIHFFEDFVFVISACAIFVILTALNKN